MKDGYWVDGENEALRQSDQAWMDDRSWLEKGAINRDRSPKTPSYRNSEYFEAGLPGLMARHPLITSFVVMALGGLCFLIFSLIYL